MRDINVHGGDPCDVPRYIARNPYAWPGGYDIIGICDDGGILCAHCIKENYREVMHDTRYGWNTGWRIVGFQTADWLEDSTLCGNCYRELCPYLDD